MEIIQLMLDNFLEQEYHSYDQVYVHPETKSRIFIGDFQAATDPEFHKNCDEVVTAAVNMEHLTFHKSIEHIVYPLLDSKTENIAILFEKFYEVIERHARMGNILVHCSAGISRSSTLVISYIMMKEKLTFKEAIAIVRKSRPKVLPNLGFERQLKKYEQIIRKRNSRSERVPRRVQVRTSESGKSERPVRVDLFHFDQAFPSLQLQRGRESEKVKRCIEQLAQKGIQMSRGPSGRKEPTRNRTILADKLKRFNPIKNQRNMTQIFQPEDVNIFQFLRVQNKRIFKSKTLISEASPSLQYQKRVEPLKKHLSEYRKCSLLNNMKPFQKE